MARPELTAEEIDNPHRRTAEDQGLSIMAGMFAVAGLATIALACYSLSVHNQQEIFFLFLTMGLYICADTFRGKVKDNKIRRLEAALARHEKERN